MTSETATPDTVIGQLREQMPITEVLFDSTKSLTGFVIVDEVNGFATVGMGPLAPPVPNDQVNRMIAETNRLAHSFAERDLPIAAFLDSHVPGKPEPPYPPHCEIGTGQESLVPALEWLHDCPQATLIRKDCINGFVGSINATTGRNQIVDWVNDNGVVAMLTVGICTDICVMDFVLTMLSARNHGLMPTLAEIVVYEPGCATYDLPREMALSIDLPEAASHPQALTHYLGLYFMSSRGAILASEIL